MQKPTLQDIEAAAARLENHAVKTPLLKSYELSEKFEADIYIKAECLQRIGAFKFRGAYNRLCQLSDEEKSKGVVAFSSGNHAQGVAAAAKILNIEATIVMPSDAPEMKKKNTIALGATVIEYDRASESREQIADQIAHEKGCVVVPSFEDIHIITGQGTAGLELMQQAAQMDIAFDQFYCPIGGGGLMSGCATAIKSLKSDVEIFGVEPEGFDDVKRSLEMGQRQSNSHSAGSLCDAILTPSPGEMTYAIMQQYVRDVKTVTDDQALQAVKYAWEKLKLVVEPGGAVALAALLAGKADVKGKTVCLLLSGGNVDAEIFQKALSQ